MLPGAKSMKHLVSKKDLVVYRDQNFGPATRLNTGYTGVIVPTKILRTIAF
jgi:hypothetical protein